MKLAPLGRAAVIAASTGPRTAGRRERAARLGSDWNAIMELRASVAPLTCSVCGAAPCVNPSFCAACRLADQQGPRLAQREVEKADAADHNQSANFVVPIAASIAAGFRRQQRSGSRAW
jgi:hypothetical protein